MRDFVCVWFTVCSGYVAHWSDYRKVQTEITKIATAYYILSFQ